MQALGNLTARPMALRFGRRDHTQPAHSGEAPVSDPSALTLPPSSRPLSFFSPSSRPPSIHPPSILPPSPPPAPPDEAPGAEQGAPLNFFYQHPNTGEFHHSHGLVALLELARRGERPLPMDATPTESSEYEEGELPDSPGTEGVSRPALSSSAPNPGFLLRLIPPYRRPSTPYPERPAAVRGEAANVPSSSPADEEDSSGPGAGYPPAFYELA